MKSKTKNAIQEDVLSLSNRTIPQNMDTLFLLITNKKYKDAKDKIALIRTELNKLEREIISLETGKVL